MPIDFRRSVRIEEACHTHHGVQPEQGKGGRRTVEIDLTFPQGADEISGKRFHIDFEPHCEGCLWAYAVDPEIRGGDTAERGAFNGFVQAEQIAPERLVTEGIEAKNLPALPDHLLRVAIDQAVESRPGFALLGVAG